MVASVGAGGHVDRGPSTIKRDAGAAFVGVADNLCHASYVRLAHHIILRLSIIPQVQDGERRDQQRREAGHGENVQHHDLSSDLISLPRTDMAQDQYMVTGSGRYGVNLLFGRGQPLRL
jgi:hypothetical protein